MTGGGCCGRSPQSQHLTRFAGLTALGILPCLGGLGFRVQGLGFRAISPSIMENHMEKKMENEMETGIIGFIGVIWGI